ncbi:MAG: tetratricopeptide repeat protein [Bryobacteraceae bacterium]
MLAYLAQAAPTPEYALLVNNAAKLLQQNRPDAAIRELTRAAALEPRSPAVHFLLGQAYLGKGMPEFVAEAKAEFQQARELDPEQVMASYYIAKIDLDLGRVGSAERELRRAIEKKPREHYLLALLGEVRRQQGYPDEAVALTTRAVESDPQAFPAYFFRALAFWDRKDGARAMDDLNRILSSPYATVEAHQTAGAIHLYHNRLPQAEASFRNAAQLGPSRAEPRLRLAQVLRRQRRYDLALQELARVEGATQLSSPYFQKLLADAAFEKGLILSDRGDAAGAKAWFERAIEMDPSHEEAGRRLRP